MSRLDRAEYGIFLPIGNGGWIISETAPHPEATYDYNLTAALLAEDHGLDFIMSMAKWRGYAGSTDHWGRTLESMTMMAGLAQATSRVKVWATVHTLLFHPALVAKMFATLDQISAGRSGLNIVTGAYADEFAQMGLWPEHLDHDARYRYTEEWLQVVLRLWTEDSVTHHGEFFDLDDCRSRPHPPVRPDLVCAGRSGIGLDFTTTYCDAAFVSGRDRDELRVATSGVREKAAVRGRTVRTYSMLTVVMDETDAAAEARVARYQEGVDMEAITNMARSYGAAWDGKLSGMASKPAANRGFQTDRVAGSPETVVEQMEALLEDGDLDGLMLIFPDFHADLDAFGQLVMPKLRAGRAVAAS